jgi:2'-hydroxyisoflavone reductase
VRILVLGGTRFVGRHIVEALLTRGHRVSVLTRGVSPDALPADVERLRGDRDAGGHGLQALANRSWDACVDVSGYTPRQVRPAAEALSGSVHRYVFISAVSVYAESDDLPMLETHLLRPAADEDVTEITGETYGPLKVACEGIVGDVYGERRTILRPQIVAGPYDPTGRYTYWVQRARQGGDMLAPGDGRDHVQVIDARDLARFARTAIENDVGGVFNMSGPRTTWARFIDLLGPRSVVWVDADVLAASGVTFVELPLFRRESATRSALMHVSDERAVAAGLTLTDPAVTIADVGAWLGSHPIVPRLAPQVEQDLIASARTRQSAR